MDEQRLNCRACGGYHTSQKDLMACHRAKKEAKETEEGQPIAPPKEGQEKPHRLSHDDFEEYTKLPVTVKCLQWFPGMEVEGVLTGDERPPYYLDDKGKERHFAGDQAWIGTLEGGNVLSAGDWIMIGIEGEMYPCSNSIFQKTYVKKGEPMPTVEGESGKFLLSIDLCPEELGFLSPGQYAALKLYGFMEKDGFRVEQVEHDR